MQLLRGGRGRVYLLLDGVPWSEDALRQAVHRCRPERGELAARVADLEAGLTDAFADIATLDSRTYDLEAAATSPGETAVLWRFHGN